ncbi:MAG: zinc ribbon domain-containing protein [Deltaproteobacteria bacterium]|nr:zinc ribbon domain-containing protein [Deltaproteobacteria bacterium]
MLCPKCGFQQADGNSECYRCGIIFSKYYEAPEAVAGPSSRAGSSVRLEREQSSPDLWSSLNYLFFRVDEEVNLFYFAGRVAVYGLLLFYFLRYIFTSMEMAYDVMPFMHLINLPFHEAGHIIFSPFGRFIMFLGGTLGQLLIPLICAVALLLSYGQNFGAAACLWWVGQNFIDVAPYINDARALNLILLGGVTGKETDGHDWENILRTLGCLKYDHFLAKLAYTTGLLLMILALAWGGYLLYRQFKNLDW